MVTQGWAGQMAHISGLGHMFGMTKLFHGRLYRMITHRTEEMMRNIKVWKWAFLLLTSEDILASPGSCDQGGEAKKLAGVPPALEGLRRLEVGHSWRGRLCLSWQTKTSSLLAPPPSPTRHGWAGYLFRGSIPGSLRADLKLLKQEQVPNTPPKLQAQQPQGIPLEMIKMETSTVQTRTTQEAPRAWHGWSFRENN